MSRTHVASGRASATPIDRPAIAGDGREGADIGGTSNQEETGTLASTSAAGSIFFDISDLLWYFRRSRTPTGVQRVQTAIIEGLLDRDAVNIRLCRLLPEENRWQSVSAASFQELIRLSRIGNDRKDPLWQQSVASIEADTSRARLEFCSGDALVSLGTSWWSTNYFLYIRHLQDRYNIRYIPFIYDMIPIVRPLLCTPRLVADFIEWIMGVLYHADHFLTISEASRADFVSVATGLGHEISTEAIDIISLDGDHCRSMGNIDERAHLPARLLDGNYVLLVSTIDVRKNQRAAFVAWRQLINRHDPERVPFLVLVGNRGYKGSEIIEQLSLDDSLTERVIVLSDVSDAMLDQLYKNCLFTIYPSLYEGWGLPVTESLSYGKVALVADNSAIPEAGGDFALYFRSGSSVSLVEQLERLIFDRGFRERREQAIARHFRPRPWLAIARQMKDSIRRFMASPIPARDRAVPRVAIGGYYPFQQNEEVRIWPGMGTEETLRRGLGWYEVEPQGTRTRRAGGELRFAVPVPSKETSPISVAIHLEGLPSNSTRFRITDDQAKAISVGDLSMGASRWVVVDVPPTERPVSLTISSDVTETVVTKRDGVKIRKVVGVGVRGIFVLPPGAAGRMLLVESLALQNLNDHRVYRRRPPDEYRDRAAETPPYGTVERPDA